MELRRHCALLYERLFKMSAIDVAFAQTGESLGTTDWRLALESASIIRVEHWR
jgi:hypothetical protein